VMKRDGWQVATIPRRPTDDGDVDHAEARKGFGEHRAAHGEAIARKGRRYR